MDISRKGLITIAIFAIMILSFSFTTTYSQTPINYFSQFDSGDQSIRAIGLGFQNYGPYTAYGRVWVFYSTGTQAVWRTKQAEEGGQWTGRQAIFSLNSGYNKFGVAFDGKYFHFVRNVEGDLRYLRGEAIPDGSIAFDEELTIFSDASWKIKPSDIFAIIVDYRGMPWVAAAVQSGDNMKAIGLSSINTEGGWTERPGWPKDLVAPTAANAQHGEGAQLVEISNGRILFAFRDWNSISMGARLWTATPGNPNGEGTLGEIEASTVLMESGRTSMVSPAENIVLLNRDQTVSRRDSDGTWTTVTPPGMNSVFWSSMSVKGTSVRLWDIDASNIRYRETNNFGETWGPFVTVSAPGVVQVVASDVKNSYGSHHSVMWLTNVSGDPFAPPYNVFMMIDGEVPVPEAPLLVSPPDGKDDLEDDVTFVWNTVKGAHSYSLEISPSQDFTNIVYSQAGITDTSITIGEIETYSMQYWRVRAATLGGTLSNWSAVRSLMLVGQLTQPVLTSPGDGVQNQPTALTFRWDEVPGADNYNLQISTVPNFSSTFIDVENIPQTDYYVDGLDYDRTYYWRVRGRNDAGFGPWSSVWSFETQQPAPEPPVLVSPEDEAKDVLISLQISWQESSTATSYRLQVSKQSNFSSTVVNVGNITGTSYDVSGLEHSTVYYWRVNASNESGTGNWSEVWNFTTIIAIPDPPVLLSPVIGSESVSTFPVIRWDVSTRAESYRLQVARDNMFSTVVFDQSDIDSTQYTFVEELIEFTRYYWRVNAKNIGGISEWSAISHFTTDQAVPAAPVLVGPDDGTTNVTNAMMLWNAVSTATGYRLQVSKNADFSSPAVDRDDLTNTFFQATNLEKFTTYYWRVRGISRVGQGYWSEVWSYETGDIVSVEMIDHQIPDEFALRQNFPNPFNPVTSIQFALPTDAIVQLEVYNMLGQRIATLIDGEYHTAGTYQAMWDARDDAGREISSGIYIYRITAGDFIETKKMTLMK